jgi:hypothetical protein
MKREQKPADHGEVEEGLAKDPSHCGADLSPFGAIGERLLASAENDRRDEFRRLRSLRVLVEAGSDVTK